MTQTKKYFYYDCPLCGKKEFEQRDDCWNEQQIIWHLEYDVKRLDEARTSTFQVPKQMIEEDVAKVMSELFEDDDDDYIDLEELKYHPEEE